MRALIILAGVLLSAVGCFAGEIKEIPTGYHIVLTEPTTTKYEFNSVEFILGDSPYGVIRYNVVDSLGAVRGVHSVVIKNIADDPETAGVDETDNAFTAFVADYGTTLYSRSDTLIRDDIQVNYEITQD